MGPQGRGPGTGWGRGFCGGGSAQEGDGTSAAGFGFGRGGGGRMRMRRRFRFWETGQADSVQGGAGATVSEGARLVIDLKAQAAELQRDLEALKARIGQMEGVAGETAVTEKEESK